MNTYDEQRDIEAEGQRAVRVAGDDHSARVYPNAVERDAEARAAELTMAVQGDPKRYAVSLIDSVVRQTPGTDAVQQLGIILFAATIAATRVRGPRGKVINATCEDFRRLLQKHLPMESFNGN